MLLACNRQPPISAVTLLTCLSIRILDLLHISESMTIEHILIIAA